MDKVAKASYQLSRYYFDLAVEDVRNYLHDDADVDSIEDAKDAEFVKEVLSGLGAE